MNITTEFLTTIGELSSLILDLSRTEESLERSIEEFEEQKQQTQIKRAEIENTMIDLISKHGTAHLLHTIPYFSQLPRVDLDPNPGEVVNSHTLSLGYTIKLIEPDDDREFLTVMEASRYLRVSKQLIERRYRSGMVQIYRRSIGQPAYLFATEDLDALDQKPTKPRVKVSEVAQ